MRLDVGLLSTVFFQPFDIDFTIEMSNITNDGIVLHPLKVLASDDIFATSGSDKDGATIDTVIKGGNLGGKIT